MRRKCVTTAETCWWNRNHDQCSFSALTLFVDQQEAYPSFK